MTYPMTDDYEPLADDGQQLDRVLAEFGTLDFREPACPACGGRVEAWYDVGERTEFLACVASCGWYCEVFEPTAGSEREDPFA